MADAKTKVIATTYIHRTIELGKRGDPAKNVPPTQPKVQIIKAGTIFQTRDKAEFDELMAAGAIRLPEKGETVKVPIENAVADDDDKPAKGKKAAADDKKADDKPDDLV